MYGLMDCVHVLSLNALVNSQHATIQVYPPCMKTCTAHPPTQLHTQTETHSSCLLIVYLCVQGIIHAHCTWCVLITQNMGTDCISCTWRNKTWPWWWPLQGSVLDLKWILVGRLLFPQLRLNCRHNRILFCLLCSFTEVGNDVRWCTRGCDPVKRVDLRKKGTVRGEMWGE